MKLQGTVVIQGDITHSCGQWLSWYIPVSGDDTTVTVKEHRFTFTSYFARYTLHFKAHGTRIKRCPKCKQELPLTLEAVNDVDFQTESEGRP